MAYPSQLKLCLSAVASDYSGGRASGSVGAQLTERFISGTFKQIGLRPFGSTTFTHSFPYYHYSRDSWDFVQCDTIPLRNVVALLPATFYSERYVIVCANYDYIGKIGDVIYNGADDNASGLTAMLALARMMAAFARREECLNTNILFIAFDGSELDMAGSRHFVSNMGIDPQDIKCVIDMDKIGTSLEPPSDNPKYVIALCNSIFPQSYKVALQRINLREGLDMCIDYTYYGSRDFTALFYASADHYQFSRKNIPSVMFTSGINRYTMKPTDDPDIIDYRALYDRIKLIFSFMLWLQ
ncbi:MAG: M28 family peptidase [Bacteroidales bacterium]|jgi:hypothetical protein|nr:M28 family peptidase [Bacteroidales bacterium]MCI2121383.1 M28 family peptidase [Bacteroidales bacterium]